MEALCRFHIVKYCSDPAQANICCYILTHDNGDLKTASASYAINEAAEHVDCGAGDPHLKYAANQLQNNGQKYDLTTAKSKKIMI